MIEENKDVEVNKTFVEVIEKKDKTLTDESNAQIVKGK